ncbi:Gfo/Idh/MocA family protein [Roseinatronobacter alkalisoli]|uniref:Gfo/Idh/MocA family oxidoreductase n=1 Tax=Roseinatronobacter alkalisoli TaxID=3028235 RepID=A0ABT5T6Y1_9RHOB|nr:Gfo/Idh/MocA family oxidoreductase [Roseinatronobacter sp. HJB301]MDD7970885.1 Gfo/Idh/MocA family oxidoreductase [Roseinatronobacter sp. HJB301]
MTKTTTTTAQDWPAPSRAKPIVIIGAGGIVRDAHLPAYAMAGLPVVGVTDLDPGRAQALARDHGIAHVHASVADAATHGTGAVYDIAVPPHAINDILTALPDGAAVLIQKPMGSDQAQARDIRRICREKGLKAAVNFQLRFAPMMMAARQFIERGRIGELLEIEVHLNIYTPWQIFPFLIPMERVEIAVHSIHYLDTIRALAGNPTGVFARSIADPRAADFAQTRTSVILDYPAPLRAIMSINHNHRCGRKFQSAGFRIEGTEGAMMVKLGVCYDYPNGEPDELWFCRNGGDWEQVPLTGSWFIEAFMGPMRNLQRFDAGEDEQLFTGVEDAYQTMALVEACFRAMAIPAQPPELD